MASTDAPPVSLQLRLRALLQNWWQHFSGPALIEPKADHFQSSQERAACLALEADCFWSQAVNEGLVDDPAMREIVINKWRGIKALEIRVAKSTLPDTVLSLYDSCAADTQMFASALFRSESKSRTLRELEALVIFFLHELLSTMPEAIVRQEMPGLRLTWQNMDAVILWEEPKPLSDPVLLRTIIDRAIRLSRFPVAISEQLTDVIVRDLRSGKFVLPHFRVLESGPESIFLVREPAILEEAPVILQPPDTSIHR